MKKYKIYSLILVFTFMAGCMDPVDGLISSNLLENNPGYKNNSGELKNVNINSNIECKVKEGSIFGLSRTCKNSKVSLKGLAKSKVTLQKENSNCDIKEGTLFGFSRKCRSTNDFIESVSN